jgi:hypothetical protein
VGPRARLTSFAVLVASGVAQSFFAPLLCGLALGLAGHDKLTRTVGWNEAYNHLGEVCCAAVALFAVASDVSSVFHLIGVISLLAAGAGFLIRHEEIDHDLQSGGCERRVPLAALLRERRVIVLIVSTTLFQFAMSAAVPFAALRIRTLQGTNQDVALYILLGAATMAPVAAFSGHLIDRFGARVVFALAFLLHPLTLLASVVARTPGELILLQGIRGVAQGIFGVVIVAVSHVIARGTGLFQALTGASRAALAAGALVGPALTGLLVQQKGFEVAFLALTVVAVAGAAVFHGLMPETRARTEGT